jgi:WD40 repeat protein
MDDGWVRGHLPAPVRLTLVLAHRVHLVSCSADKTVGLWDPNKGKRVSKLADHQAIVNSCDVSKEVQFHYYSLSIYIRARTRGNHNKEHEQSHLNGCYPYTFTQVPSV